MKKILFILLIFLIPIVVFSQTKLTFGYVDSISYAQYLASDWKNLLKIGKEAKKTDISFYYLDYRLAIAEYELKKYRKAASYFQKVLSEYPNDELGMEYLYYSYLKGGMYEEARQLWLTFKGDLREKTRFYDDDLIINGFGMEYRYYLTDNYEVSKTSSDVLNQTIKQNLNYFNLYTSHYSKSRFSFSNSLGFVFGNSRVYDEDYSEDAMNQAIFQWQYYASGNFNLPKRQNLTFAFNYANEKLVATGIETTSGFGGNRQTEVTFYNFTANNFTGFVGFSKQFAYFDLGISSSVSNLSLEFQSQSGLSFTLYPFANKKVFWQNEGFFQYYTKVDGQNTAFIFKQRLSVALGNSIRIEPFVMYGETFDFVDSQAYTIYNGLDRINYWYGVNFNIKLGKSNYLYAIYQNYNFTNEYKINSIDNEINYNSQTFLGGIVWNF